MSEAKHTKGPWTLEDRGYKFIVSGAGGYITRNVCRMDGSTMAAFEQLANAALIAAAPTFYEGAEAFIAYEEAMERGADIEAMLHYAEATRLLRSAMKQATSKEL